MTGACHAPVVGGQGKSLTNTALASPVPIEKSAEFEMDGREDFPNLLCLWAAALKQIRLLKGCRSRRGFCKVGTTCKPRQRLPQKPHTQFPLGERNALLMRSVKSAFALLLTKVTKPAAAAAKGIPIIRP